ncbi:O-antigen ligase domain-containing protein [Parasphingorhabdus sp. DH2-15]|uniref:O-antigen ligase domain-containing protein n=1 Tax=Parasphingorhabdus sp. DH2-15 TaxID=3444112 RepID=UPI003F6831C9
MATWPLWLVGGLYIAGPVLGFLFAGWALLLYYIAPNLPEERRLPAPPMSIMIWIAGMLGLLIVLWIGHFDQSLGTGQTIKSSIGWAKGWLLIALFLFAGAVLPIKRSAIVRAVCKVGAVTLIVLPIFLAAPYIGLPSMLWVSPLKILGGSGPEYFATILYTLEPGTNAPRWQFFAPWSPAAGMIGLIYFLCALEEKNIRWKAVGLTAALAIMLLSQSRLALVGLILLWPIAFAVSRLNRPVLWLLGTPFLLLAGWFALDIIDIGQALQADFAGARADSTRVREALGRIAVERWQNEAYWFGHGIVERGPHLVEYMPIGSHHSWYGLLFVKGLSGLFLLAIPLVTTLVILLRKCLFEAHARLPLSLVLLLIMYSFGENLESLAYLYWPALIIVGQSLQSNNRHMVA